MAITQLDLAKILAPDASAAVRKKGQAYYRAGRVGQLLYTQDTVLTTVQGTSSYKVAIGAVDESTSDVSLSALCTCPYFESGEICKHIWATVLKIQRTPKAIEVLGLHEARDIVLDPVEPDELAGYESAEEFDDEYSPETMGRGTASLHDSANGVAGRSTAKGNASDLAWLERMKALTSKSFDDAPGTTKWPPEKQVVYLIDPQQTLRGEGVVVNIATRQRKRNGEWGKMQSRSISESEIRQLPEATDRRIFTVIHGVKSAQSSNRYGYGYGYRSGYDGYMPRITLAIDIQRLAVELIARTGRCFMLGEGDSISPDDRPLRWDDGEPWKLKLAIERDDEHDGHGEHGRQRNGHSMNGSAKGAKRRYVLRGYFERGSERLDMHEPRLLTAGGLLFGRDNTVAALHEDTPFGWVLFLRQQGEVSVGEDHVSHLLEHVLIAPRVPELALPDELHIERVTTPPKPRIRIYQPTPKRWQYSYSHSSPNELHSQLSFEYDEEIIDSSNVQAGVFRRDELRYIERDHQAEQAARERAIQAGFRAPSQSAAEDGAELVIVQSKLIKAVNALVSEGWHVEAEGALYRQGGSVSFDIRESGIDWFEMEGEANFDGQIVGLPTLLKSLRKGEKFIPLGDGSFGVLPEEWIARYGTLSSMGRVDEEGRIKLHSAQIGLIDALIEQMPEVSFDAQVARAREKLKSFTKIRPRKSPRGFTGTLRPYQQDGLGWMHFLRTMGFGGCLADDMGLGKTVQVLALLEQRRQQRVRDKGKTPPSLVVVPRSLLHNWRSEATRFTPKLRVLDHTGNERHAPSASDNLKSPDELTAEAVAHFDEYDLILTTYGTLRRDVKALKDVRFDYVILDEAQAIKNAETVSAKAARLLQADHRLALSGTPIENHLGELWSLFEFLNPGMLGHNEKWITRSNGQRSSDAGESGGEVCTHDLVARAIRPYILRRTKQQVASDLPEKTEQTLYCELKPAQRKLYDELRDYYRASLMSKVESVGLGRSKIMVLEALLRLRQAACHPALIEGKYEKSPSAKIDALMPQLLEVTAEGHKALVFSQFTSFLAILRKQLDAEKVRYAYLDGRTRKRADRVHEFQEDPDCKLFLISLKAGGLGLNLTAAEYVFLLDPWWNPAVEAQAIDRAHRIGQTRNVFAYRLIARDTVEEKVLELQQSKRELAESIIRADANLIRSLTVDDLRVLLS
jgi:superfamily II DNA or RNA helicase